MAREYPFLWYFGCGSEPEHYYGGFATRDEAIAAGHRDHDPDVFSIVEAQKGEFAMIGGEDLVEQLLERWGDDDLGADDYPELEGTAEERSAAVDELDALLEGWFEKHRRIMPIPWSFAATRNNETFNVDREAEA